MKRHGRYELLTPEELKANAALYEEDERTRIFICDQLNRHRSKHRNTMRHKRKQRDKNWHT